METEIYDLKSKYDEGLDAAAAEIIKGNLVIFPTETVYGIGSDAADAKAVKKIYEAKGRPSNNPLIAHIWDYSQLEAIVSEIPEKAKALMEAYWPGPLTIVFKSNGALPDIVSGGLDTIAVRMPSSPYARELLKRSGKIIVAPSANLSGKPSGTTALDCYEDFNGRVGIILDGGECEVGLESTVISLTGDKPVLLRPGGITLEMLEAVIGEVNVSKAILNPVNPDTKVESPGMLYKHYSPNADVLIVKGDAVNIAKKIKAMYDNDVCSGSRPIIFCPHESTSRYEDMNIYDLGNDYSDIARNIFSALRESDRKGFNKIYFENLTTDGIGLAINNRIIRAAGFHVLDINKED